MINGRTVHRTNRHYGYEGHYIQTAAKWLEDKAYIPKHKRASNRKSLQERCKSDLNIHLECFATEVQRKKHL